MSDIDTGMVASLKVLDPKWPIREADIVEPAAEIYIVATEPTSSLIAMCSS